MRVITIALSAALAAVPAAARAVDAGEVERLILRETAPVVADGIGGVAVAVRIKGRTLFVNHGLADVVGRRPVSSDMLFNLASVRKLFEATLLAHAVQRGELRFDDPVSQYVTELRPGAYVHRATLGQLAAHTSGLLLPTDHPPWPRERFTLAEFIRMLNEFAPAQGQAPGQQHTYTHAGYILLALALERRFGTPIGELIERRLLKPLGMRATLLPDPTGAPLAGAAQGYGDDGKPIGVPGDQQGFYDFPGSGQMYSSARDLARFAAAQLNEGPADAALRAAMQVTQRGVVRIDARHTQALAWEINDFGGPVIVDKPGGTNNAAAYVGLIPAKRLGLVMLSNRGERALYDLARDRLLPALARLR